MYILFVVSFSLIVMNLCYIYMFSETFVMIFLLIKIQIVAIVLIMD